MKSLLSLSVNIVTPSYNQGKFISQTIESVLSQQNSDDKYWIMDGGSSDQTVGVLKGFGKLLNWVSESDKGQTDAINKGVARLLSGLAPSDIVAYLNSDDYYLPGTISKVREYFSTHPKCMWLVGDAVIVNEKGLEIQKPIRRYKQLLRQISGSIWMANSYPQPSVFLRVGVLKRLGDFDASLRYVMDYEYWLRITKVFGKPDFYSSPLSAFRIHASSKGSVQFKSQFREGFEVVRRFTGNPVILGLHQLHNQLILLVYSSLK